MLYCQSLIIIFQLYLKISPSMLTMITPKAGNI